MNPSKRLLAAIALLLTVPAASALAASGGGAAPTVSVSDPVAFHGAVYTVHFSTTPGGALSPGSTITLTAPLGTDFFYDSTLFRVAAAGQPALPPLGLSVTTTGPAATLNQYYGNQATLTVAQSIPASTLVTVTATGVTNPGPGDQQVSVATSAQPAESSTAYPISGSGRAFQSTYTNPAGTRYYLLYRPADWARTRALIVDLPGCTETSSVEARWSRFTDLAAQRGFSVLLPEEDQTDNGAECWNWFEPSNWNRGSGEPSIIAGITQKVVSAYGFDPGRVFMTGISAGGVMSDIMAVTYPDLYRAVGIYAGCEYEGLPCFAAPAAQPPAVSAQAAVAQMGPRLRAIPAIVVHGDVDEVVPAADDAEAVQQWLYVDGKALTGNPSLLPQLPASTVSYDQPGKQPATISKWTYGRSVLAEEITVHGMAHQWSDATDAGTPEDALITDPSGPDVTTPIVDFFLPPR